jgi:signal transduction histidine kinase
MNRGTRVLHFTKEASESRAIEAALGKSIPGLDFSTCADVEACEQALESGTTHLIIASDRNAVRPLHEKSPHIPILLVLPSDEIARAFEEADLAVWDAVSRQEMGRLRFSALRAIQYSHLRGSHSVLQDELLQAKDTLLKCQKSITVGRLLGSIAHEINNPLESLANLIYLAQRNAKGGESLQESLQIAERELERVGEITKQILSFHRDSRDIRPVSVADLLESLIILFRAKLAKQRIEVVRHYRCKGRLAAHSGELRQALSNLLSNAIDAMPDGGRLYLRIQERTASKLCITVADTGSGMSRAHQKRMGELFFTTKGEAGTGLGMWVTRHLIAKYDGCFRIYSSMREGRSGTVINLCFTDAYVPEEKGDEASTSITGTNPPSGRTGGNSRVIRNLRSTGRRRA